MPILFCCFFPLVFFSGPPHIVSVVLSAGILSRLPQHSPERSAYARALSVVVQFHPRRAFFTF